MRDNHQHVPLAPGSTIGPYEIVEPIGKGGMGEVFRAHDSRLRRDVAIKTSAQQFGERFEREARAIAALNHPNICQIYDVGPDYLVMELVEGRTLAERIAQGAIPIDEALRIADQIAEALAAAHEKQITHRDLKPGNIKITDAGAVKVLDFGLAKFSEAGGPGRENFTESPTITSPALTEVGMILGTAAYMSPEQARGKPVDSRADIWAFGVVLYEMLTARLLFRGDDVTETLASILKESPNLDAVPVKVRRLLEACLQKDPRKRLQSISDRHFLLLAEAPVARPNWLWPAVAGVVMLALGALAWVHFRETPPVVRSLRYQLTRPRGAAFTQFQLSPDGRYLAFIARSGAVNRLYVRALDSLEEREFPGTDGTTYPFWSPDSAHIAFFSQGKLKQVAVGGGPATSIADAPDPRGGAWGPDDTIVFAPSVTGTLSRVSAFAGGLATPMDLPRTGAGARDSLRFPAFVQGSNRFFYTIEAATREGEGVYVASLDGTPPVRILPDLSTTRFVPSPGSETLGHILFRRDTTLMAQPFDAANLKTSGEAIPVASPIPDSGHTSNVAFTVSSNGTLIYMLGGDAQQEREVVWLDRSGKRGKSLLKQKNLSDFALSPDGAHLAYSLSTQLVAGDMWLLDVARGVPQRFTFGPFNAFDPVWSPDSASVIFTVYPEDRLARKAIGSSAKEETLRATGTNTYASSWSADGKWLAYTQTGVSTKNDLWLLPLGGDEQPRLFKQTRFEETNGQISPDGRWLAYVSDKNGQYEVYVEALTGTGGERKVSADGGISPVWRKDGRELYFVADTRLMAVAVKPGPELTFGMASELFRENFSNVGFTTRYQASADGSQFLFALRVGDAPGAPPLNVVTSWQSAYARLGDSR